MNKALEESFVIKGKYINIFGWRKDMEGLRFKEYAEENLNEFVEKLIEFVGIESPSCGGKQDLRLGEEYVYTLFSSLGCKMSVIKNKRAGDIIRAEMGRGKDQILLIGHYDTVFPKGSIKKGMDVKVEDGMLYGPGALDMKGGIMIMYFAIKALKDLGCMPEKRIVALLNGDEETGSSYSRDAIMDEAAKSKAVICLEPAPAGNDPGRLKTERLGRGVYKIMVHGKSAHAGNNPHEGISPILEIGRLIEMINGIEREYKGITATIVYIKSGAGNIAMIPDYGEMLVDIRFNDEGEMKRVHEKMIDLKPFNEGIRLEVIGEVEKPLMIHNNQLFQLACTIGNELGVEIKRTRVGGGSDGNFTSGIGIPTIDGMGMTGEAIHNVNERVYIENIPFRVALLARMIQEI